MSDQTVREIAARFATLWDALSHDGDRSRPPDEMQPLLDQVRDALDRRSAQLNGETARFIAGSFALEELVHEGAGTEIHRIRHRDLGTLHALKMLRADRAKAAVTRELLLREGGFGLALRHENVAATQFALRLPDGRPALVLEWLPHSLARRLASREVFTLAEIRLALGGLLHGLAAIHRAGLVHADIAPDNLLFADDDFRRLKIADFGIAVESGRRHADIGLARAGHHDFAAPEQLAGKALDPRSDLYACGRIILVLLTRCAEQGEVAERLWEFARLLTQEDPARRPQSAMQVLTPRGTWTSIRARGVADRLKVISRVGGARIQRGYTVRKEPKLSWPSTTAS